MQADHSIKIENGIPFPEKPKNKYPFKALEVGQSFVMPKPVSYASAMASQSSARLGKKFRSRKIDENSSRIWRLE